MKRKMVSYFNKVANLIGCQVVSSADGRNIDLVRHIIKKGGELNILDLAIKCELKRLNGEPFIIVQIGANDGERHDPYRQHIEKNGFSGVLVEPNTVVFKKLLKNYERQPQLKFENVAIGAKEGNMTLYTLATSEGSSDELSVYSSLNLKEVVKFKNKIDKHLEIIPIIVPVITYQTLLQKNKFDHVSLLALDTEGYDYEILKTIDFSDNKPVIIEYEHGCLSVENEKKCQELLIENGYKLNRCSASDTIAISNSSSEHG